MPTLMVSISGIRGLIGDGLSPEVIVKFTSAYAKLCGPGKIILGRDSRISGMMVKELITGTLSAMGNDIVDIGICPTPTVLFNVKKHSAAGGIAISASHNPNEWNALKLLNDKGEFLTPAQNEKLIQYYSADNYTYEKWDKLGKLLIDKEGINSHLNAVLKMKHLQIEKVREKKFKVVLDCVNGAGSYVMPELLTKLGCEIYEIDCDKSGIFPRLPEPIPENLTGTMEEVKKQNADLGIVVDPDVDRLVLITDKGEPFGEENTITQAIKFILSKEKGNAVVNLSTTRGAEDVARENGCELFRSPVGEANVVDEMKKVNAVIGGEGSGGVIYPEVVFGRDALTGTVILLQHLTEFGGSLSELKKALPEYYILKNKIDLGKSDPDSIINKLVEKYRLQNINTSDGLRIDLPDHWVHFRKSNTEPIIRCIVEAETKEKAKKYIDDYFEEVKRLA